MSTQPFDDTVITTQLYLDRSTKIGVSNGGDDRGSIHTYIKNLSSNPVPVQVIGTGALVATNNIYNEITSVVSGVTSTIISFLVPSIGVIKLLGIFCSGENVATYEVLLNSSVIAKKRTYFGSSLDVDFSFAGFEKNGLLLANSSLIEIKVSHNRPMIANFNSNLIYTVG